MANTIAERFEAKVDRTGDHHVWTGAKARDGTGQVRANGRLMTASRLAWELAHGPLPMNVRVKSCPEEPACVRLEHLALLNLGSPRKGQLSARGGGSKREIRKGVWQLSVTAGQFADGATRRVHRTVRADSEAEATALLAQFVTEVNQEPQSTGRTCATSTSTRRWTSSLRSISAARRATPVPLVDPGNEPVAEVELHVCSDLAPRHLYGILYDIETTNHKSMTRPEVQMPQVVDVLSDVLADDIVDTGDVARVLGATQRSIARWQAAEVSPRRDSEERLLELKAVVDLARQYFRPDVARLWLRSPDPSLAYEKPLDLVKHGEYRRVIGALLALAEGVTS